MSLKAIKISEENYRWLIELSAELQKETGRVVSIDKALAMLHKGKISELAGSWEISEKEAKDITKSLSRGWKRWKISS